MFRLKLFQNVGENIKCGISGAQAITHPAIVKFQKHEENGNDVGKENALKEIVDAAKAGDRLCMEFLAFDAIRVVEENSDDSESENYDIQFPQNFNSLDMAREAINRYDSPIGHYVVFKQLYRESRFTECPPHLAKAIASEHPDILFDLRILLVAYMSSSLTVLEDIAELCPEFKQFKEEHSTTIFDTSPR